MLVDLIQTAARDGVRLDGAYQAPGNPGCGGLAVDAVALIHGTGGSFYSSTLFDALAEELVGRGVGVLRANTRGHDLMSTAATPRGGLRAGAAYEAVDDCRHDLHAWASWLRERGGPRIGLVGHSLGAVKCLYAQAREPAPGVVRVAAISPPRLSHAWFLGSDREAEFREAYGRATALVAAGEPEALLDVRVPLPFLITAAGYVEKYGPDERYNYLSFLGSVTAPVLLTLGEVEVANNMAFRGAAEAVAGAAPGVCVAVIPGADHFYGGASRKVLARKVADWLKG